MNSSASSCPGTRSSRRAAPLLKRGVLLPSAPLSSSPLRAPLQHRREKPVRSSSEATILIPLLACVNFYLFRW